LWAFFGYLCQWLLIFFASHFLSRLIIWTTHTFCTTTSYSWHWLQWRNLLQPNYTQMCQWSWWCKSMSLNNSQCLLASANALAIVVLREWQIYYGMQCDVWKISFLSRTCIDSNKMSIKKVEGRLSILKSSSSCSWTTHC